jgi:hypothetical protein
MTSAETLPPRREKMPVALVLVGGLICAVFLVLIWSKAMSHGISHDEHQFIAPAVLLANEGLLPYRDFPIFHMPNLVLIYAVFALFTDYYLLSATAFGAICAWIMVCVLFVRTAAWQESHRPSVRLLIAAGFAVMLLTSQNFIWTTGRAWNHDFPVLMTVLAFVLHLRAARASKAWPWLLLSGACVGLAIGGRLTYLPLVAPFGLAVFFIRGISFRQKIVLGAVFGGGVLLALLPSFYFLWKAPEAFYFDNFKYPRLRLLDPTDVAQKTFTVKKKAQFLWRYVALPNWPLFAAFLALGLPVLVSRFRQIRKLEFEVILLALLLPFIVQGCVSPSRTHTQHFYSLIPFLVLAAAYGFSRLNPATMIGKGAAGVLAALVIVSSITGFPRYDALRDLAPVSRWSPIQAHHAGIYLREKIGDGKLLTYGPIGALEGGLRIYPETATGPFAIRLAHYVTDVELRRRLHFVTNEELPAFLAKDRPAAIQLGEEDPESEAPFRAFAEAHHYRLLEMGHERKGGRQSSLWLKPE